MVNGELYQETIHKVTMTVCHRKTHQGSDLSAAYMLAFVSVAAKGPAYKLGPTYHMRQVLPDPACFGIFRRTASPAGCLIQPTCFTRRLKLIAPNAQTLLSM